MADSVKCLVFDCDGVLLDSVPVKTRAFARLAEPYGQEAVDRLVMYHARHGGVSRFRKFAWFYEEILGREITPEESEAWGRKFADLALEEVRKCPLIPGVEAVLQTWAGRLPMYVCSGAPKAELDLVLAERKLAPYFKDIVGSPPAKSELLKNIVKKEPGFASSEFLMVGDASTDRNAAEIAETQFYGIGQGLKGGPYPWSENLLPLNQWLKHHAAG